MDHGHDRSSGSPATASAVDVLSDALGAVRLTGSMLFLVEARSPWITWAPASERFRPVVLPECQHLVSYHIVTQGGCWAGLRDAPLERFEAGDILVVPHGDAYALASAPDAAITYGPEQAVQFFRQMAAGELPSVVYEDGGAGPPTKFICGFLGCDLRPFNPVLAALPPMIHLRAPTNSADRLRPLIEFAQRELHEPSPGGRSVMLRLAELMFIEVVRRHLETIAQEQTGWLAGLRDPLVARALALLHEAPAHHWTLGLLAAQAGASRSVLAERFTNHVGLAPMRYLMQWRMQLASRRLTEPGSAKLVAIAEAVGYASEAAFSRAFKKSVGVSPALWRRRAAR